MRRSLTTQTVSHIGHLFIAVALVFAPQFGLAVNNLDAPGTLVHSGPSHVVPLDRILDYVKNDRSPETMRTSRDVRAYLLDSTLKPLVAKAGQNARFHYGALNFRELFNEFAKVRFFISGKSERIQAGSDRLTDLYFRGKYAVIFNENFNLAPETGKEGIILHTLLGAIGLEDENYQLTVAIELAAMCESARRGLSENLSDAVAICHSIDLETIFPASHQDLVAHKEGSDSVYISHDGGRSLRLAGGFTGVGGGGDSRSLVFKLQFAGFSVPEWREKIFSPECAANWKDGTSFLLDIMPLRIEVSDLASQITSKGTSLKDLSFVIPAAKIREPLSTGQAAKAVIETVCAAKAGAR